MINSLPISMNDLKDLKDFVGYYDWSENVTIRARTAGSTTSTNPKVDYASKDIDDDIWLPSARGDDPAAITVGYPKQNNSNNVIIGSASSYTRELTAHIRGAFRVVDGNQTLCLKRAGSTEWARIYVGSHEVTAAVIVDVFPDDSILILAGNSTAAESDPFVVQFIPWKTYK